MHSTSPIFLSAAKISEFLALVDHSDRHPKGCWEWQGAFNGKYGYFGWSAHRVAFWVEHQRQPVAQVLHTCDNPACCRPSHLFEGTQKDNVQDCIRKGRFNPGRRKPNSKNLTPEQKQYVIESTKAAKVLARELGCTKHNIWRIRRECPQQ